MRTLFFAGLISLLFSPNITTATTKDFLVSGKCGNVNANGVVTFLEQDGKVLVRERLAFEGTSSGQWSDRIADVGQWSATMSEQDVAVLSEHPEVKPSASRKYSLSGKSLSVSEACNLTGKQTTRLGDASFPVVYAATTREGVFPGGEVRVQYDPFGAVILVSQDDGTSCLASIFANQSRKIGESGAQVTPKIQQIVGPKNCIPSSRGATVLLNRNDVTVARVFRSAPILNLAGNGNAAKVKAILAGNMSGLGTIGGALQTSAESSVPWPEIVELEGGMANVAVDTKGISLNMSAEKIRDEFGLEVIPRDWNFFNSDGLEPHRIKREDVASLKIYGKNTDEERESIEVGLSQWHTGNWPLRIDRNTVISTPHLRPTKEVFEKAILNKYGTNYSDEDYGRSWHTKIWNFDSGKLSSGCKSLEVPKRLIEAYGGGMNRKERLLKQVLSNEICDGFVQVRYKVNGSGFVEQYSITLMDTLGLVFDSWNDERVTLEMQQTFLERLQSESTASPKL